MILEFMLLSPYSYLIGRASEIKKRKFVHIMIDKSSEAADTGCDISNRHLLNDDVFRLVF